MTGIGLGRNPNGAVHDYARGLRAARKVAASLLGMIVGVVAVYGLRLADVIDNWPFVILLIARRVVVATPSPPPSSGPRPSATRRRRAPLERVPDDRRVERRSTRAARTE